MPNFLESRQYDENRVKELFVQFHCYKLTGCPDGPKVCGFDDRELKLAVFEDVCTLYKANCKGAGMWQEVDMVVCETQKAYEAEHKDDDTFEFIHLSTQAPATPKTDYHWMPRNWQPRIMKDYEEQIVHDAKYL